MADGSPPPDSHPPSGVPASAAAPGTLYLVGTPIGNLRDITLRAIDTLASVSRIAAEDTRRTRALLSHLGIAGKKLHSIHAGTTARELERLVDFLEGGESIALVTDAGMPSVSDPGAELVTAALTRSAEVVCIPGPSAVTTAAALSGLVNGPFAFLGFLPRKGKKRASALAHIEASTEPVILFESPVRTRATLVELADRIPDRLIAVCRELTKLHEEVLRGTALELAEAEPDIRGEVTLVVAGARGTDDASGTEAALDDEIAELLERGQSVRDVVQALLPRSPVPRAALYARVQEIHDHGRPD